RCRAAHPRLGSTMNRTPALALLGLLLILFAIPLALSIWPLAIGIVLVAWAARRAHLSLADVGDQPAPGPAAAIAASTPSA
ncbi:MAG TPA: hypothetical protein VF119_10390, partial [Candidatus Limnocylindrales bacterium]